MIFITGDTHADFSRFKTKYFKEQKEMTKNDVVIICGDFGGVWNYAGETRAETSTLDWMEDKNYTTLFIDGNHENFDRLKDYPMAEWNGGIVHEIRPHVLHLCRGQVFTIEGLKFFTFGGARSHDIDGGVLELDDPDLITKKHELDDMYIFYRINHLSWWKEEMPTKREMISGLEKLREHNNKVDFILTHDCPASTLALMGSGFFRPFEPDELNYYLEEIRQTVDFKRWYFGHYHNNRAITDKEIMVYEDIVRIY